MISEKNIPKWWEETTLGEVIFPVSETYNFNNLDEIHFLNTGDILEGKLLHNNYSSIHSLPWQAKKKFKRWDILYSEIRPENKRFMLVDFDAEKSVASTKLMVLRCREGVDTNFIYKLITSNDAIKEFQIIAESRSGTFPQITFDAISKFPVFLPPLPEQRAIADIVSSFDAKIQLLRDQNETLEKTVQTIFHEWFGRYSVESPEGLPEGWRVGKVDDILDRQNCSNRYSAEDVTDKWITPVYEQWQSILLGFTDDEASFGASIDSPMFIFGDHTCITKLIVSPFSLSPNTIPIKWYIYPTIWVYYAINWLQKFIEYRRHWMELINKQVALPEVSLAEKFVIHVKPLIYKIAENEKQIRSLYKTRDVLLPKMMSGEVRLF